MSCALIYHPVLAQRPDTYDNSNVKNVLTTSLGAGAVALVLLVVAFPAYGWTLQIYTMNGFVEHLIEKGIIPERMVPKARELVAAATAVEKAQALETPYSDQINVHVSQLIQHASRTYKAGGTIDGLLLLVTNESKEDVYPAAKRGCQVVYRIYKDGKLLYDSATAGRCATTERVTYRLTPGQTRMFEITHNAAQYSLAPGSYTFTLEYPGYGSGSLPVIVE